MSGKRIKSQEWECKHGNTGVVTYLVPNPYAKKNTMHMKYQCNSGLMTHLYCSF